jgi:nucleoside transporter
MNTTVRVQLWIMMFIEFFIWGIWFVTLSTYLLQTLKFSGLAVGQTYSTVNWAAIAAPFFVGMVADRFFSAEKVMGVLHLIGAAIMFQLSRTTDPTAFFGVALAYSLCYMPTLALVNAISFHQMKDPSKEFPSVRVWGTLGWIVAGFAVSRLGIEDKATTLQIAAGASVLMGVYSFMLPNTPPRSHGKKVTVSDVLSLDALRLMKDWSFAVFVVSSLLICIPLAFYYTFTNPFLNEHEVSNAAFKQTMGQMSEVFFMIVMPLFLLRLGVKKMLAIGMLAWVVRYFLFAYGNAGSGMWMWYIGILLHGVCYDFFFVTGQLYVDRKAPEDVRASAQGFIGLITYGWGMLIGAWICGPVVDKYALAEPVRKVAHNWQSIWLVPGIMAGVILALFWIMFHENNKNEADANAA